MILPPRLCGDAWETTYLHVLTGPDPVFRWISGTGRARAAGATRAGRADFVAEYQALLAEAYPPDMARSAPFRRFCAGGLVVRRVRPTDG